MAEILRSLQFVITTLDNNEKGPILSHLKRLNTEDRYMRFFAAVSDSVLSNYVDTGVDLTKSKGFGIFDPSDKEKLIAFAHLSSEEKVSQSSRAELGISVDLEYRNLGLARRLLDRTLIFCKASGINTLFMSCLRQNSKMQRLAKSAGLRVILDHEEALAELNLPEYPMEKAASISHEIAYEQISIMDNCYRKNMQLVKSLWT
jgi:RimJ/RimL family protein N-acetyltransferase